jgi:hypothetical protein
VQVAAALEGLVATQQIQMVAALVALVKFLIFLVHP